MRRKLAGTAATVLLVLSVAPAGAQEGRRCKPEDIRSQLRVSRDSYPAGEPVRMRLVMENTSTRTCTMELPSGRYGTVRVYRSGELIWEYGVCRAWTAHLEYQEWEPGHRAVARFRWKQHENARDEEGRISCEGERKVAEPGSYRAEGVVYGTEPDEDTARVPFEITS